MKTLTEIEASVPLGAFSTLDMETIIPYLEKLMVNEIYLEIGVDKGKSLSVARIVTKPDVYVCGIDIKPQPDLKIWNMYTKFFQGRSHDISLTWRFVLNMWKVSLLFIDGDHTYEGCSEDLRDWYPHMKRHGVIFLHDCDESSPGVMWAASEFANTHTVDKFNLFKRTDKNTSMAMIQLP